MLRSLGCKTSNLLTHGTPSGSDGSFYFESLRMLVSGSLAQLPVQLDLLFVSQLQHPVKKHKCVCLAGAQA